MYFDRLYGTKDDCGAVVSPTQYIWYSSNYCVPVLNDENYQSFRYNACDVQAQSFSLQYYSDATCQTIYSTYSSHLFTCLSTTNNGQPAYMSQACS